MKEKINLKDRNGKDIHEGDIVKFVIEYDYSDPSKPTYDSESGSECIDTVRVIDGEPYFCCPDTGGSAFAWRHNDHCEVIGSVYLDDGRLNNTGK